MEQVFKRFGKCVQHSRLRAVPATEDLVKKIEERKYAGKRLEIIHLINEKKELNAYELLAILAQGHGTGQLPYYAKALRLLAQEGMVKPRSVRDFGWMIRKGSLKMVEEVLKDEGKALDSLALEQRIPKSKREINKICNLLEVMGRIVRLPSNTLSKCGRNVWIHSDYRNTSESIPWWNIKHQVLEILSRRSGLIYTQIAMENEIRGLIKVKERNLGNSKFVNAFLFSALDDLRRYWVIYSKRRKEGQKITNVYFLSDHIRDLIRKDYLDETLRKILLGVRTNSPSPRMHDMVEKILRWTRVMKMLERKLKKSYIARLLDEKGGYVESVASGSIPWRGISKKKLFVKYLPLLEEYSSSSARFFKKKISS